MPTSRNRPTRRICRLRCLFHNRGTRQGPSTGRHIYPPRTGKRRAEFSSNIDGLWTDASTGMAIKHPDRHHPPHRLNVHTKLYRLATLHA